MRKTRFAPVGLLALVAGIAFVSTSSAPTSSTNDPAGSQVANAPLTHAVASLPQAPVEVRHAAAQVEQANPVHSANYIENERIVRLADPMELPDVAARHGLDVVSPVGRSGYAVLRGEASALAALRHDPAVASTFAHAKVLGASNQAQELDEDDGMSGAYTSHLRMGDGQDEHLQWYIDKVDPPLADSAPTEIVVAVLDTGVAYETATRLGVNYVQAPSLASSPIVAPYDFVNDDPHANDDHQHGTHIASLVASNGDIKGTAPGVALMPIKVLDANNRGNEYSLVEGIWWAIDNGADIINMSLSFGPNYQPSLPLVQALEAASDAGIFMVAATGNAGLDMISWPAASPVVMAVAGGELTTDDSIYNSMKVSPYANLSGAVDIVAPSGNLTTDFDHDAMPDGILAEAISPDDPTEVGYWLMTGTSQASAQVAGLAVEILREGLTASEAEAIIKAKAERPSASSGRGSGFADMDWSASTWVSPDVREFHVALLPFLAGSSDTIQPKARVTVFDGSGEPAADVKVVGSMWGNDDGIVSCETDALGQCFLVGSAVPRHDAQGAEVKVAWSVAVEAIATMQQVGSVTKEVNYRPTAAMTYTPEFDAVVDALQSDASTANAILAWTWSDSNDEDLGSVVSSFSLADSGSGLKSIPLGFVGTEPLLDDLGDPIPGTLGVSGEEIPFVLLALDGVGLKSIPLGFDPDPDPDTGIDDDPPTYVFLDGTGLKSIPLGFRPGDTAGDGESVPLDDPATIEGTALGDKLNAGGWRVAGYGGAAVLSSSSLMSIVPGLTDQAQAIDGVALQAVPAFDTQAHHDLETVSLVDQHQQMIDDMEAFLDRLVGALDDLWAWLTQ